MKVAVTGATGNVGTALLRRLDGTDTEVVGVCRRLPEPTGAWADVRWVQQDVAGPDAVQRLTDAFAGVDAVVTPRGSSSRAGPGEMARVNLTGSENVVRAALAAGVPRLVHLSSVGAYATHPVDDARVDESWPDGRDLPSQYSREKAAVESHLDWWNATTPNSSSRGSVRRWCSSATPAARSPGTSSDRSCRPGCSGASRCRCSRCRTPAVPGVHADDLADAWPASWNGRRVVRSTWPTSPSCGAGTWRCR